MIIPKKTMVENFIESVDKFNKEKHILRKKGKKYVSISTKQFRRDVIRLAIGLKQIGVKPGDKVNIIGETSYEWLVTDLAILSVGAITVPIYPTLPADQTLYIINDSESTTIFYSSKAQWEKIKTIKGDIKKVKHFISFIDEIPSEEILTLSGLKELGGERSEEEYYDFIKQIDPDDLATIIYTSGTTGLPKGAMLTHYNIFSNTFVTTEIMDISEKDTCFSFLPLSHILERMVTQVYVRTGATIAYAESIEKVAKNITEVKPTIMVSVPRLFERVYTRIMDKALSGSPSKKKIFLWALSVGDKKLKTDMERKKSPLSLKLKYNLTDKLVFGKAKHALGGNFRFFISGGAALPKKVGEFFYKIGIPIREGYGLTETSPVIAVNTPKDFKVGTVGKPIPGEEVKIAEDGEILAKGPNIMTGYYKKEEETKEVFTEDGWFKTGDIGFIDEEGFLAITDRKKAIIVTLGGKNVAPQPIENRIKQNPFISNVVVIGNERKYLSALIIPEFDKIDEIGAVLGKKFKGRDDFVDDKDVQKFFLREVKKMVPDLADFEVIKRVGLLKEDFSIDGGELTPTLKVKRTFVEKKYKKIIDALY
jgi:long-chain acyl-CoA synthetase